jgi:hypothetical protein
METAEIVQEPEIFTLGYWNNAYRDNDKEYFWMRSDDRKEAKEKSARRLKNGQPKRFIDWCGGSCKHFSDVKKFIAACNKVGINPNLEG